jgi:hypothetical protein
MSNDFMTYCRWKNKKSDDFVPYSRMKNESVIFLYLTIEEKMNEY